MNFRQYILISILIFCFYNEVDAQEDKKELIQFSGIIVTADSINPVSFANIIIKGSWRGTVADYYGYFFYYPGVSSFRRTTLIRFDQF